MAKKTDYESMLKLARSRSEQRKKQVMIRMHKINEQRDIIKKIREHMKSVTYKGTKTQQLIDLEQHEHSVDLFETKINKILEDNTQVMIP